MYVATYICKRFNLIEEAESYGYLCMEKCLAEAAWQNFYKVVDLVDSLKVRTKIFVIVYHRFFNYLTIKTVNKTIKSYLKF